MSPISEAFKKTIEDFRLLAEGDRVLAAYSGGMDSTALVHLLLELKKEWDLDIHLGHFNHGLRRDAASDEVFVRRAAEDMHLPLYVGKEDVRIFADKNRLNLEEAGRILRYDFLKRTADRIGGAKIATGHTLNDQAETFLMRLFRGSGILGLTGVSPSLEGRVIRPLIRIRRKEVLAYLRKKRLDFRRDESNRNRRYFRNRVRLDLIPYLERRYGPDIVSRIGRTADILRAEEEVLDALAGKEAEKVMSESGPESSLDIEALSSLPLGFRRRVIRRFIRELKGDLRGITYQSVQAALDLGEGKKAHLTKNLVI